MIEKVAYKIVLCRSCYVTFADEEQQVVQDTADDPERRWQVSDRPTFSHVRAGEEDITETQATT